VVGWGPGVYPAVTDGLYVAGARAVRVSIAAVASSLVLASCTSGGAPSRDSHSAHVEPAGPAEQSTRGGSGTPTLTCSDYIGTSPPISGMRVVDGVVALPASPRMAALGTARTGSPNPAVRLFAKTGLQIRTGATFTLAVPRRLARVASIGWGPSVSPTRTLAVRSCHAGHARWLAYAGGYFVRHTMCLPLVVRTNGRRTVVHIGVGVGCPGQEGPPGPTQR
jgi:hypothetical protein